MPLRRARVYSFTARGLMEAAATSRPPDTRSPRFR
nr:MAG TPA: hypothetical protein [Caudoviricetes sp.]